MPEKPGFNPEAKKGPEIKIDLKAPKTAEQWCELYRVLSGKDVYHHLNWGNEEEAQKPLTYQEFKSKTIKSRIDFKDIPLIAAVDELIQK